MRHRLRTEDLDWTSLDGEVVVLDARRGLYWVANATLSILWPALVEGATDAEMVAALDAHFDVTEAEAGADIGAVLADLRAQGLLEST